MLRRIPLLLLSGMLWLGACKMQKEANAPKEVKLFEADHSLFQYTGRIDFSDPKKPRFWAPGVYIQAKFKGPSCEVVLNDEELGGKNHNYLEVVIDNQKPVRLHTTGKVNSIKVAEGLSEGEHTITICKNTESNLGYLEFVGLKVEGLAPLPPKPQRKIEFIGNSITCGTGADESSVPCGKGEWHDQHNAYMAYGPRTARNLNAQWHLTAVSGIGLMRSCCNMGLVMPQVFDKISLRENKLQWDFQRYQPDIVTIALGQNDGIQDSTAFTKNYITFLSKVRDHYPQAEIVCLTSPMANPKLNTMLQNYLTSIVNYANQQGDKKVHKFFFSRSYNSGCDNHPSLAEHELIANELTAYLKKEFNW